MDRKLWKWLVAAGLVLGICNSAHAGYVAIPGAAGASLSPGAAPFNAFLVISPGLYGDKIYALEEGRDNRGHFCAVTFATAPANPITPNLMAIPAPISPGYPAPPAGFYGPTTLIYRATDDPANPGWAALPGGPQVSDSSMRTIHGVCENFNSFRTFVPPPGVVSWINIEADLNPLNATFMEFYKFRVIH